MYVLKVEHSFDSAHFLAAYEGKCGNIHGHRWKVEIEVQSDRLIDDGKLEGMVIDFSDFKNDVKEMVNYYDHAFIVQEGSMREATLKCLVEDGFRIIITKFRPTAENFAAHFYSQIKEKGYEVKRATVYETPTNSAVFE